ncbi:MAG TPA: PAS domain-containing protein [Rhizomicrobium sp.]
MNSAQSHPQSFTAKTDKHPDPFALFNAFAHERHGACFCDPELAFVRLELKAVAALWREKAGPRPMPLRDDLDARSLKPFLPNMTLIERVAAVGHRYRLRLHGTSLTHYAGDHTGHFVEEMIPPEMAVSYTGIYDLALAEGRPLRVVWDYQVPAISYLKGESFLAPLMAKDGSANLLLSVTYAEAKSHAATRTG